MFDFLSNEALTVIIGVIAPFVIWTVNSILGAKGKFKYFITWIIAFALGLGYAIYSQGFGIFQNAETVAIVFTTANLIYKVFVEHLEKALSTDDT